MSGDQQDWTQLQRIILPPEGQVDTIPLYVDAGTVNGIRLIEDDAVYRAAKLPEDKIRFMSSTPRQAHFEDLLSRTSMKVRSGDRMSFGTYFNAFPASYWRRWTTVRDVRLSVSTQGEGAVVVYKSNARGSLQRVASERVSGKTVSNFELSLKPFGDGGWYWFDLVAGGEDLILMEAQWLSNSARRIDGGGSITLEITTMNKPDYCLNNAKILADNLHVLDCVKEFVIVDQGDQKVLDYPGFKEVAERFEGRLRVIEQANLGGSGGFSRGMYEALENESDYALLLDDDVVIEPDSIARLAVFADYCRKPTIAGGHMFDLYNRTVLHTFGEVVDAHRIQPALPHQDMELRHDFAVTNLRQTPWMHRRTDVDYNGWWMCLIPTEVIRQIGLSMPLFLKWDDAEYGLRAKEAGFATVSLPGAAVWHVSWADKDDLVGWQAYFHERNRAITALLHSPFPKGGRVQRESLQQDVKHLIAMQYFTERGRIMAMEDLLEGPEALHRLLAERLPQINALRSEYPDAQLKEDFDDFPHPRISKGPHPSANAGIPAKKDLIPWALKTVIRQLVRKPDPSSEQYPQTVLAHKDNRWWRTAGYDSIIVTNAEGTGASWYRRDPAKLRAMMAESSRLHAKIYREWESLAARYQAAVPQITSYQAWRETFEKHTLSRDETQP